MTDTPTRDQGRLGRRSNLSRLQPLLARLPLALLALGVVVQGVILFHLLRDSWFGLDTVNYLTTRGPLPDHDEGILRPYAGHWSTIPVLVYRLLFAVFGMHSYLPYVGVAVVVHLVNVFLLYFLLRAAGARPWPSAVAAWLLLFFGAGAEAFMWDAAFNQTIPLLLALVACLLVVRADGTENALRIAAVLCLLVVMCSGAGVSALVLVGGVVTARSGIRSTIRVIGPATVALAIWLVVFGRSGGRASPRWGDLHLVPSFLWEGLTGATGVGLGITRVGGAVLCLLVVVVVTRRMGPDALRDVASAGVAAALVHLSLVTLADARLSSDVADSGRYIYVVLALLGPGIALVAQVGADQLRAMRIGDPAARSGRFAPVLLVLVVAMSAAAYARLGITREQHQSNIGSATAEVYRAWVYGSIAAVDAGERQLSYHWDFAGAPFGLFASPALRSRLPSPPERDTRLDAEAMWFVDVGTQDSGMFSPTRPTYHGLRGTGAKAPGCHDLTTDGTGPVMIDVPSSSGTEIGVTSNSTEIRTQLFRHYTPSPVRTWTVSPGPVYVATSAREAILRVVFNGSGTFTVCHQ